MGTKLSVVVLQPNGRGGKRYRRATDADLQVFASATLAASKLRSHTLNGVPAIPDEPLAYHPQYMLVRNYGLTEWGKLFNDRQLMFLTTLARLSGGAYTAMLGHGLDDEYAKGVATYLALAISRLSSEHSVMTRWNPRGEKAQGALGLQAFPMVWDFAELNPWGGSVGHAATAIDLVSSYIESYDTSVDSPTKVASRSAQTAPGSRFDIVVTDPPYYDSINYSDLSDFYYVWLKRSIGFLHPDLLSLPLTPKREQTVMNVYANGSGEGGTRKELARKQYLDGMAEAFEAMASSMEPGSINGVVFAHTNPDAWSTLIEGLLRAGLVPNASWPIDTEIGTKLSASTQARLKTSVWMACRKREEDAENAFLGDVLEKMRPVVRERLRFFWSQGIRGADFFISAIGPALSVFGRHRRVLRPDGTEVSVRDFLDIVRRESTTVALEQVLQGADLGVVDPITRQYVTWVWSYSRASLDSGETLALCLATGAPFGDLTREHSIAVAARERSKKVVKLRTIAERAREDDDLGRGTPARPAALIDELQRAAWLWSQNQSARLGEYRGALGESRWAALLTLGQAVAECLPDGDEDRRIILGLLGATVRGVEPPEPPEPSPQMAFMMEDDDGAD